MVYISLLNNITLLICLGILHSILLRNFRRESTRFQIFSGLLFGLVAVVGMLNGVLILPGIFFDGRSIILVTAGTFGGPITALVAAIVSATYRYLAGGSGTMTGILVIFISGVLGTIFYFLRERFSWAKKPHSYLALGIILHLIILFIFFVLMGENRAVVLDAIIFPLLTLYPLGTMLICLLFQNREDLKMSNERLIESEIRYRTMFDTMTLGIVYQDATGKIIAANPAAERALGLSIDQMQGRTSIDARWKAIREDGSPFPGEEHPAMVSLKTGMSIMDQVMGIYNPLIDEYKWLRVSAIPQFNKKTRKPSLVYTVFEDITYRKKNEEELLKLSLAVEQGPASVIITGTGGEIEYVNPRFTETSGYSAEELKGKKIRIFNPLHFTNKEDFEKMMQQLTSGIPWQGEHMNRRKNLDKYWEFVLISPLRDKNNQVINYILISEEITAKKKLEAELIEAKNKAEESDQLKTAFLNNLSHEIRTPLNAIVGFTEFISRNQMDQSRVAHFQKIIKQSSDQLLGVIDDVFHIAAIEAGQVKLFERKVNINEMMERVYLKCLAGNMKASVVKLAFEQVLPDDACNVITDDSKLSQILANLIQNGIKFTHEGQVSMSCAINGTYLLFKVEDTGIGIQKKYHEKIFERFRQIEVSNTREYGGSGMGLAISKSYVELLGGQIWLESEPGNGSRFYFTLPYKPVQAEKKSLTPTLASTTEKEKKTVLVAEDDKNNYFLIQMLLEEQDLKVLHALNGRIALELCQDTPYIDLIIMDIKMPEMDGYESTRRIRKIYPSIPIIALTAYAQEEDKQRALQSGCTDYISKPVTGRTLQAIVNKYINRGNNNN